MNLRPILMVTVHLLAAAGLIGLLSFAGRHDRNLTIAALQVENDHSEGLYFVDNLSIERLLRAKGLYRDSMPVEELHPARLEQQLRRHPHIRRAEVYLDTRKHLYIKVWQRSPVLRVVNRWQEHCYIDTDGRTMALSPRFTAPVLVGSGYISHRPALGDTLRDPQMRTLAAVAQQIRRDPWLDNLIVQLYVDTGGEYELIPRLGGARILMGDTTRWAAKTAKLKEFCRRSTATGGLTAWTTINLSYKNQIVCQK
jgi:cell division protein FtsQ